MEASTGKRLLLIVSGALAAGVSAVALYRVVTLAMAHAHVDRTRLAVFGVVLAAGFCLGLASVWAGVKGK